MKPSLLLAVCLLASASSACSQPPHETTYELQVVSINDFGGKTVTIKVDGQFVAAERLADVRALTGDCDGVPLAPGADRSASFLTTVPRKPAGQPIVCALHANGHDQVVDVVAVDDPDVTAPAANTDVSTSHDLTVTWRRSAGEVTVAAVTEARGASVSLSDDPGVAVIHPNQLPAYVAGTVSVTRWTTREEPCTLGLADVVHVEAWGDTEQPVRFVP